MCGLVGVAGKVTSKELDVFKDMLIMSTLRGVHSTGIAVGQRDKTVSVLKGPMNALDFIEHKKYDKVVDVTNKNFIIGHNRHATIGKHTWYNAHPFEFEHLVGAHNGTIDYNTRSDLDGYMDFDTDSEALFQHINNSSLKEALAIVSGAWALSWFDKRDRTINFVRNDQRTLYYAFTKDRKTLLWASEPWFIHAACSRRSLGYEKPTLLTEDTHYAWEIPTTDLLSFSSPKRGKVVGKPTPPVTQSTYSYGNTSRYVNGSSWVNGRLVVHTPKTESEQKIPDPAPRNYTVVPKVPAAAVAETGGEKKRLTLTKKQRRRLRRQGQGKAMVYRGYKGKLLTQTEFEYKFTSCYACDSPIVWGDSIRFLSEDHCVCQKCRDDTDQMKLLADFSSNDSCNANPELVPEEQIRIIN